MSVRNLTQKGKLDCVYCSEEVISVIEAYRDMVNDRNMGKIYLATAEKEVLYHLVDELGKNIPVTRDVFGDERITGFVAWNYHIIGIGVINRRMISIPKSIGQLTNLKNLSLANNWLTVLPKSMQQLRNLKKIDLSGNYFTVLPEWIGKLNNLEELVLADNQLAKLPDSLLKLNSLRMLNLERNELSSHSTEMMTSLKDCEIKF